MATDPNKFTKATRETLAKRASQTCSNPDCNLPTVGPHADHAKAIDVGEAAHIRGAKPGSKRYDRSMTPAERSSIVNGIWLCRKCAKLIDSDEKKYTVEVLYEWKRTQEAKIEAQISGKSPEQQILNSNFASFRDESPTAQQIVLDKPPYWEFLLTIELLIAGQFGEENVTWRTVVGRPHKYEVNPEAQRQIVAYWQQQGWIGTA